MSHYTPDFGQLGFSAGNYSTPSASYSTSQLSTPTIPASGESTFQGFISPQNQESARVDDAEATAEEKRRRNTAASGMCG